MPGMKTRYIRQRSLGVVALGCAVVLGVLLLWLHNRLIPFHSEYWGLVENGVDLDVYRGGAFALQENRPLYTAPVMDDFWFTYPPFAALVFFPLIRTDFETARALWCAISVAALFLVLYRCVQPSRSRRHTRTPRSLTLLVIAVGLTAASTSLESVRSTLWYGQVNLVLLAAVFLDLTRPASASKGWTVGVAAGIKLTSLIFVPYLLITRQFRAAGVAVVSFAATIGIAAYFAPVESRYYWTTGISDISKIAPRSTPANQSLAGVMDRLYSPTATPSATDVPLFAPLTLWLAVALFIGVMGFIGVWIAHRKNDPVLAVSCTGLVGCVLSPFSWGHHWVWFVPLLGWFFVRAFTSPFPRAPENAGFFTVLRYRILSAPLASAVCFLALGMATFMWTSLQPELPFAPVLPGYATGIFLQPSFPPLGVEGQIKAAWYPLLSVLLLLVGGVWVIAARIGGWRCTEDTGRSGLIKSSDKTTSPDR